LLSGLSIVVLICDESFDVSGALSEAPVASVLAGPTGVGCSAAGTVGSAARTNDARATAATKTAAMGAGLKGGRRL
jgi:hypothetical protein